jgi:ABC-type protease/lipase transport system fused ATPase/permease subunit
MADKILLIVEGKIADYGPREQVMARFTPKPQPARPAPESPAKLTEVES